MQNSQTTDFHDKSWAEILPTDFLYTMLNHERQTVVQVRGDNTVFIDWIKVEAALGDSNPAVKGLALLLLEARRQGAKNGN